MSMWRTTSEQVLGNVNIYCGGDLLPPLLFVLSLLPLSVILKDTNKGYNYAEEGSANVELFVLLR